MGKTAKFTFLNMRVGSASGNKQHRLEISPSKGTGARLQSPPNLTVPAPTAGLGPYDQPVILKLSGWSAPEGVANPTWSASWTRIVAVVEASQYVIESDDADQNGGHEDLVVALVLE